jgi:hypothetical protein
MEHWWEMDGLFEKTILRKESKEDEVTKCGLRVSEIKRMWDHLHCCFGPRPAAADTPYDEVEVMSSWNGLCRDSAPPQCSSHEHNQYCDCCELLELWMYRQISEDAGERWCRKMRKYCDNSHLWDVILQHWVFEPLQIDEKHIKAQWARKMRQRWGGGDRESASSGMREFQTAHRKSRWHFFQIIVHFVMS